jgi:transposase
VQVDGYAGYRALERKSSVQLAFCWSHLRIASEALESIAAFYAIEKDIRGCAPDARKATRQDKSRPILDALEPWLREKLALVSQKSKLAVAIRYARPPPDTHCCRPVLVASRTRRTIAK